MGEGAWGREEGVVGEGAVGEGSGFSVTDPEEANDADEDAEAFVDEGSDEAGEVPGSFRPQADVADTSRRAAERMHRANCDRRFFMTCSFTTCWILFPRNPETG
jgi:hypothetical protein